MSAQRVSALNNERVAAGLDDIMRRYREMTYEERVAYWDALRLVVQLEPEHPAAGGNILTFPTRIPRDHP